MNLYELTLAAESEVSMYRNADIDKWIMEIDPVFRAAGVCTIGTDKVEDITVSATTLTVRTSYSVRCCSQTQHICLPIQILKEDKPIQAAMRYKLEKALSDAKDCLESAKRSVSEYTEKVSTLQTLLDGLGS
jgi:hypothetical protein